MKRDFDLKAILPNGQPINISVDGHPKVALYKDLIVAALSIRFDEDSRLLPKVLYERGKLANKIDKGGSINVTKTEVCIIKKYAAKAWAHRIIVAIYDFLDEDLF